MPAVQAAAGWAALAQAMCAPWCGRRAPPAAPTWVTWTAAAPLWHWQQWRRQTPAGRKAARGLWRRGCATATACAARCQWESAWLLLPVAVVVVVVVTALQRLLLLPLPPPLLLLRVSPQCVRQAAAG